MLLLRRIIFWVLSAIYVVVCPVLILYSLGYIFNPVEPGLEHTGLVSISTIPAGADIFLGNSRFAARTPATIPELLPGHYSLRLSLKGHKPWKHNFIVEAGRARVFKNVLLLPRIWRRERLSSQAFKSLIPLDGTDFFLLATGDNLGDHYVYDWKGQVLKRLIPEQSPFFSFHVLNIYTQENSARLIVYGGSFLEKKYLLMEAPGDKAAPVDITGLFSGRPEYINWGLDSSALVFTYYPGRIGLINLKTFTSEPGFLKDVKGFGIYKDRLYYLDAGYNIIRASLDNKESDIFSEKPFFIRDVFGESDFYQIKFLRDKVILFLNGRGRLLTNLAPYRLAEDGVVGIVFNEPAEILAHWTRRKITMTRFSKNGEADSIFEHKILSRAAYEKGRQITQCFWVIDEAHLIFKDADQVFLLEIEPQSAISRIEPLFKVKSGSLVFYSDSARQIYYLDPKSGKLYRTKI